jgi:glycosyltransferase involved in cell wall biosynthesis
MSPLVSILIPAYNAAEWIADTIASAQAQTWPRKEIIVVDDGSRDDTLATARRFASRDVAVVAQENAGASAARNRALALCQGDYIQWLDADDLLTPDKIDKQMAAREQGCTDRTLLSCGWGHFIYRPRHAEFRPSPLWCDLSPAEWLIRKLAHNVHMQTATWLVSRALTEAAGPWDTRLLTDDDGEYFCRVLLASDGVKFVPEGRVLYRMTGGNRLSYLSRSPRKLDSQFASMQKHITALRSLDDGPRARAAAVSYLQTWLHHFHPGRPDIVREAQRLAVALGGCLQPPRLSWKYAWIPRMFGPEAAKRAQTSAREMKWALRRSVDRALFHLERRAVAPGPSASH